MNKALFWTDHANQPVKKIHQRFFNIDDVILVLFLVFSLHLSKFNDAT